MTTPHTDSAKLVSDEMVQCALNAYSSNTKGRYLDACMNFQSDPIENMRAALEAVAANLIERPADDHDMVGYRDAWYEICTLLEIPAMAMSPKQVHESVVMPKLRGLLSSHASDAGEAGWIVEYSHGGEVWCVYSDAGFSTRVAAEELASELRKSRAPMQFSVRARYTHPSPTAPYYKTHEPPHCPTCDCGEAAPTSDELPNSYVKCATPGCNTTFGGSGYGEWPKVCPDCQAASDGGELAKALLRRCKTAESGIYWPILTLSDVNLMRQAAAALGERGTK